MAEMELDEVLHARAKLNDMIRTMVQQAASPWGMEVRSRKLVPKTPGSLFKHEPYNIYPLFPHSH